MHAERRRRVAALRKAGRVPSEEETPFELELVNSPTLILPDELMAEIFDWHMLMGGKLTTATTPSQKTEIYAPHRRP